MRVRKRIVAGPVPESMPSEPDWERRLDRAEYALFRGKWRSLERTARRMIARYPDRPEGYVFAAGVLRRQGRNNEALCVIEDAFNAMNAGKCAALGLVGAIAVERGDEPAGRGFAAIATADPVTAEKLADMPALARYHHDLAYQ